MGHKSLLDDFGVHTRSEFGLHRGRRAVGKATRVYVAKIPKVGVHIERKTVHCNPAGTPHTNGAHLAHRPARLHNPHSCGSLHRSTRYAPLRHRVDDCTLDGANVALQPYAQLLEVQNGVANNLTGAVKRDVAPTVDVLKLRTNTL